MTSTYVRAIFYLLLAAALFAVSLLVASRAYDNQIQQETQRSERLTRQLRGY